jgi:hypothetical protein
MLRGLILSVLLLAGSRNLALAEETYAPSFENRACINIAKKVPKTLEKARKLAPLVEEIVKPDLDYCTDDLSKCDLRTLVFKGFSLRLLHHKPTHDVDFHIAEFSSIKIIETFCGKECVSFAEYNEKTKKYVIDCQADI